MLTTLGNREKESGRHLWHWPESTASENSLLELAQFQASLRRNWWCLRNSVCPIISEKHIYCMHSVHKHMHMVFLPNKPPTWTCAYAPSSPQSPSPLLLIPPSPVHTGLTRNVNLREDNKIYLCESGKDKEMVTGGNCPLTASILISYHTDPFII